MKKVIISAVAMLVLAGASVYATNYSSKKETCKSTCTCSDKSTCGSGSCGECCK